MRKLKISRLAYGLLYIFALISVPSVAQSEKELIKELAKADITVDGEVIDAINVATKSLRATPRVRGAGRLVSSYFVAVGISDSTITVWFVPRTVDGESLRLSGAVETKVMLRRKDLKVLNKELFM